MKIAVQYRFLSVVCSLFDGTHYVSHKAVVAKWPGCPSRVVLGNIIDKEHCEMAPEGYFPRPAAFRFLKERRDIFLNTAITFLTLLASLAALVVTVKTR